MSEIAPTLKKLFENYRIVFWYDEKRELRQEFEDLKLPGVTKVEIGANLIGLKYRLLRGEPETKFLVYHEGPPPPDRENWLLDVELAHTRFSADQASLWAREVGLGVEDLPLVSEHAEFFRAAARRSAFKARRETGDTRDAMRMHMLAICAELPPEFSHLEYILFRLLEEYQENKNARYALIQRSNLDTFLWREVAQTYGYRADQPGVADFVYSAFKAALAYQFHEDNPFTGEILLFFNHWQNDPVHQKTFVALADQVQDDLGIEEMLVERAISECMPVTLFRVIDQHILRELIAEVTRHTRDSKSCLSILQTRRRSPWFEQYEPYYQAVASAAQFFDASAQIDPVITSLDDGLRKYSQTWYRLDLHYRHFIQHLQTVAQPDILKPLFEQVENHYVNRILKPLNDRFQEAIDALNHWESPGYPPQTAFFDKYVRPLLDDNKKAAVIVSDALRYEIAKELEDRIGREDRFEGDVDAMLSCLPSFTQLGMAALLPHRELALRGDGTVLLDGQSTLGTDNRQKALARVVVGKAIQAKDFLQMTREEQRSVFREHQVLYLFHNRIDMVGDKRDSEARVFAAVEETLDEIVNLVKKLANANYTHILVTSDHGFLYQHRPLEESDFTSEDIQGQEILYRHRRFVLGRGFAPTSVARHFQAQQVGLAGDIEIMVVKSIHRLRQQGTGSRYVHGGAALQEVVVPVLFVKKARASDVSQVELDIINVPDTITTGQLAVRIYQTSPVTPKRQSRTLRVGIYASDGTPLSNQETLVFDSPSTEARERETKVTFTLSRQADAYNKQEVLLKMEEPVPDTQQYRKYKTLRLMLRKSLSTDFDF